jgi:putative ABC transport system permease protein
MDWNTHVRRAARDAGHDLDPDVVEELGQHADLLYAQLRADGSDAADAEARVQTHIARWVADGPRRRRGTRFTAAAAVPPAGINRVAGLAADLRYAVRVLRRRPATTALAALTIALGIGATTVLFTAVRGVLLKPLPWPDSDRLVLLSETHEGGAPLPRRFMTNGPYLAWRESHSMIEDLGAWASNVVTLTGAGEPRRVRIASATASLFAILRARPEAGVMFTEQDERDGSRAVLSHALARELFSGSDPLGRAVTFDGISYTVIGVMPAGFEFLDPETVAWTPMRVAPVIRPDQPEQRFLSLFSAIARLRPGVSVSQATDEGTARARQAPDGGLTTVAVFGSRGPARLTAVPMLDAMTADVRPALYILLAAVGLLLLTATANVASVQLARATARYRELAVRAAIGAGTGRLAQQLVVENVMLAALGGALGLFIAWVLVRLAPQVLPTDFPRAGSIVLDRWVALFTCSAALLTGLVVGSLPALHIRRLPLVSALADDAASSASRRTRTARLRSAIMTGQVAVATVLLVVASLTARSFSALLSADRGYVPSNVLSARIPMPDAAYPGVRRAAFVTNVLSRVRGLPGVTAAGFTSVLPLGPADLMFAFTMPDASGATISVHARLRTVSPGYLEAMGIRLVEGRPFAATDTPAATPAVVVNRSFANKIFPNGALGRSIPAALDGSRRDWVIVGIADDVHMRSIADPTQPEVYVSYTQLSGGITSDPSLVIRTAGDPAVLALDLRSIVRQEDPSLALESVMTMSDRLVQSLAKPRLYAVILGGFAVFAVLIAGVGLFGVLSYAVALRSREIGVRTALGAAPRDIISLVVRQSAVVTAAGVALGLGGAYLLAASMSTVLYGVRPADPPTFLAVPAVLGIVALAACVVPARRAAALDPLRVLKGL